MRHTQQKNRGFTLIELSIVLVIIGLIVGGVLFGQDLIKAAAVRAQVAQIEKYNTAANTFYVKYGYLPGDIPDPYASQFGFAPRDGTPGNGDGNGIIEGSGAGSVCDTCVPSGEPVLFWNDLSSAIQIGGTFTPYGQSNFDGSPYPAVTGSALNLWLPPAKIGFGNYVYVYSNSGVNYFGISGVSQLYQYIMQSGTTMPVSQAYAIDKKIDDGLPQSGAVTSMYIMYSYSPGGLRYANNNATPGGDATTCFDTTTGNYSFSANNGSNPNCALSFKMQGAAR